MLESKLRRIEDKLNDLLNRIEKLEKIIYKTDQNFRQVFKKIKIMSMWRLENMEPITDISQVPEGAVGFIYEIRNFETEEWYIGKKSLYSTRTLPPLKGYKRKRKVTKQSDWLTYKSSSKIVKDWVYTDKIILKWCYTKKEMTYEEIRALMCNYAMEDPKCMNENISGKFFKGEFTTQVQKV